MLIRYARKFINKIPKTDGNQCSHSVAPLYTTDEPKMHSKCSEFYCKNLFRNPKSPSRVPRRSFFVVAGVRFELTWVMSPMNSLINKALTDERD